MERDTQPDHSACPSALVLFPALIGSFVWLWALLAAVPQR